MKSTSGSKAADKVGGYYCTLLHVGNKLKAGLTVLLDAWQTEECLRNLLLFLQHFVMLVE